MLPIGDDNTSRRIVPLVTYALIVLNVLFFLVEMSGGDAFIMQWAFVPSRFLANPIADFPTLSLPCSCMPDGFTWAATCFTCGSSVTMWKTALGTPLS